jgi:hypothetical protein
VSIKIIISENHYFKRFRDATNKNEPGASEKCFVKLMWSTTAIFLPQREFRTLRDESRLHGKASKLSGMKKLVLLL